MSEQEQKTPQKSPRHRAREIAVQGLYQWRLTQDDISDIESQLLAEKGLGYYDKPLFTRIFRGAYNQAADLESKLMSQLDRPVNELSPVEYAILLLGSYELAHHTDAPYRVIINEAVELAKTFGSNDGHKYVNGVLDKLAAQLRPEEWNKRKSK